MSLHSSDTVIVGFSPHDIQVAQHIVSSLVWWGFAVSTLSQKSLADIENITTLEQSVKNSDVILILYSVYTQAETQLKTLQKHAMDNKKPIIPIQVDDAPMLSLVSNLWKINLMDSKKNFLQHMRELAGAIRYPPALDSANTSQMTKVPTPYTPLTMPIPHLQNRRSSGTSIFIDHHPDDDVFVNRLVLDLENKGYITWVDHLANLSNISTKEKALQLCDCMLSILSPNIEQFKGRADQDWSHFYDLRKPIIPILLEDASVPLLLRMHQQIHVGNGQYDRGLRDLLRLLAELEAQHDDNMLDVQTPKANGPKRGSKKVSSVDTQINEILKGDTDRLSNVAHLDLDPIVEGVLFFPEQQKVKLIEFTKPLIIGRQHETAPPPDVDLTPLYAANNGVSRRHLKLEAKDNRIWVTDLDSTNGTFIRGKKLPPNVPRLLRNKESFKIGSLNVKLFYKVPNPSRRIIHDIFLSYSRRDDDIMRRVQQTLVRAGFSVWVDEESLEPGTRSWRREVSRAIDGAGCLVAIFTPAAKQSEWVEKEIDYAETQKKTIFSILASGSNQTSILFGYTLNQWVDIRTNYAESMKTLVIAIKKYLKQNGLG